MDNDCHQTETYKEQPILGKKGKGWGHLPLNLIATVTSYLYAWDVGNMAIAGGGDWVKGANKWWDDRRQWVETVEPKPFILRTSVPNKEQSEGPENEDEEPPSRRNIFLEAEMQMSPILNSNGRLSNDFYFYALCPHSEGNHRCSICVWNPETQKLIMKVNAASPQVFNPILAVRVKFVREIKNNQLKTVPLVTVFTPGKWSASEPAVTSSIIASEYELDPQSCTKSLKASRNMELSVELFSSDLEKEEESENTRRILAVSSDAKNLVLFVASSTRLLLHQCSKNSTFDLSLGARFHELEPHPYFLDPSSQNWSKDGSKFMAMFKVKDSSIQFCVLVWDATSGSILSQLQLHNHHCVLPVLPNKWLLRPDYRLSGDGDFISVYLPWSLELNIYHVSSERLVKSITNCHQIMTSLREDASFFVSIGIGPELGARGNRNKVDSECYQWIKRTPETIFLKSIPFNEWIKKTAIFTGNVKQGSYIFVSSLSPNYHGIFFSPMRPCIENSVCKLQTNTSDGSSTTKFFLQHSKRFKHSRIEGSRNS